jgi:uncharacterized protein (DUF2267 family)
MSSTGLEVFDRTLQATNEWLKLMMRELGTDNRRHAFNALRAALHAVRDRIGPDNAIHLGAQLPMLLRGAYYEGWRPTRTPTRERRLEEFLDHVAFDLPYEDNMAPSEAARATFAVLTRCLDPGEAQKLFWLLPGEARYLWPREAVHA